MLPAVRACLQPGTCVSAELHQSTATRKTGLQGTLPAWEDGFGSLQRLLLANNSFHGTASSTWLLLSNINKLCVCAS